MRKMIQSGLLAASMVGLSFGGIVNADEEMDTDTGMGNNECPVGLVNNQSLDDEFGAGSQGLTRCLERRHKVKVVVQINQLCRDAGCTSPYALGNINNMIKDYEITHGMQQGRDYEIVAVVHSGGWGMLVQDGYTFTNKLGEGGGALGDKTLYNDFQETVEGLMDRGVRFLFCQNTTRGQIARGNLPTVKESNVNGAGATEALINGVEYTTAGITALVDFQRQGYKYVQP